MPALDPTDNSAVAAPVGPTRPRDDELDVYGVTHVGKVRADNQDHFLFCTVHKALRVITTSLATPELLEIPSQRLASLFMVADGVGGNEGGEAASRMTVETMAMYFTHAMHCYFNSNGHDEGVFREELQAAAQAACKNVMSRAREKPEAGRMATTLTIGMAVWPQLYVLQVGDSRAYRVRGSELVRLTRDQTMAQDLVDRGAMSSGDAARSPLRNILSSAIGRDATPEVSQHDLDRGDVILLCSDGLTNHVPEERILAAAQSMQSCEQLCRTLLDEAMADGGSDNITILAVRSLPER
ncbi:MAG TPA: protein phosphatase 2C domain-containing protein [Gemmatimonadales bacterium]|nr:protein phosphatase 2C domain-containing protein [Gemmatimonadales bacterium]